MIVMNMGNMNMKKMKF